MKHSVHPGMTREQLIKHRKRHLKNSEIPVIVVTAMPCVDVICERHPLARGMIELLMGSGPPRDPVGCLCCDARFRSGESYPDTFVSISQSKVGNISKDTLVRHAFICIACVTLYSQDELTDIVKRALKLEGQV